MADRAFTTDPDAATAAVAESIGGWHEAGIATMAVGNNFVAIAAGQEPHSLAIQVVPEPATLVLLMFAAAGWCLLRVRAG